jgi:hypothetical protein
MLQVCNGGPHLVEFDSLAGKKILFTVDRPMKQLGVGDSSFRVKRICCDPLIIEQFCSQGPYLTPTKVRPT